MAAEQPVLLVELERDLAAPADGWVAELDRRGVVVVADDLGRLAIDRSSARAIYAEARESEARKARKQEELEQQAVEKDRQFRASLPGGVPADQVPEGVSAGLAMMLADPMQGPRRTSVLEDVLANPGGGGVIFRPLSGDAP
jgi:hypothetical protein